MGINWNLAVSQSNSGKVCCHVTCRLLNARAFGGGVSLRMAARSRARQERDRSRSAQPAEDDSNNEGEPDQPMEGRNSSKLYAALFVVPGIFLYVYMLYIVWANLLYPASLTPFMPGNSSASSSSTGYVYLCTVRQ